MRKIFTLFIVIISLAFGFAELSLAMRDTPETGAKTTQIVKLGHEEEKCSDMLYLKLDGVFFKVLRKEINGIFKDNNLLKQPCESSLGSVIDVDKFTIQKTVNMPFLNGPYRVQFQIEGFSARRNQYEFIASALRSDNKEISDLPKTGSFYVYGKSGEPRSYYISTDSRMFDLNGDPIVLSGCHHSTEINFLNCNASFKWKGNIDVFIRTIGKRPSLLPRSETIDDWLTIFPMYKSILEKTLVNNSDNAEELK